MVQLVYNGTTYDSYNKNHSEKQLMKTFKKLKTQPTAVAFTIDAFPCQDCQALLNGSDIHFTITVTTSDYISDWISRFPPADQRGWAQVVNNQSLPQGSTFQIQIRGARGARTTTISYINGNTQRAKNFVMGPYVK